MGIQYFSTVWRMGEEKSRDQGRYLIRFPEGMRERLDEAAEANKRSLNAEIVARLEESFRQPPTEVRSLPKEQIVSAAEEVIYRVMATMFAAKSELEDKVKGLPDVIVQNSESGERIQFEFKARMLDPIKKNT